MRWLHLYTALFLAPWLLIYASSAFFLNHNEWFREYFNFIPPGWAVIQEQDFKSSEISLDTPELEARKLLTKLDLQGEYRVLANSDHSKLVVLRYSGAGDYRVTWLRSQGKAIVERFGPSSLYGYLHYLHFKSGYERQQTASDMWAMVVDFVTISIWIWVISGLYFWIRRRKNYRFDILIFASGVTAFTLLATLLYL